MFVKEVEILIDAIGQPYLGCSFSWLEVQDFMPRYYELEPNHEKCSANRKFRDGEPYHMTFMNVGEYRRANMPEIKQKLTIELLGVGKAVEEDSFAYFIVCTCPEGQEIRKSYGLSEKDFHITLGFDPKDVFKVRKNEVI